MVVKLAPKKPAKIWQVSKLPINATIYEENFHVNRNAVQWSHDYEKTHFLNTIGIWKLNSSIVGKLFFLELIFILTLLWSEVIEGPEMEAPRFETKEADKLPCFCCFNENPLVLSFEKSRLRRSLFAEVTEAAMVPRSWKKGFKESVNWVSFYLDFPWNQFL